MTKISTKSHKKGKILIGLLAGLISLTTIGFSAYAIGTIFSFGPTYQGVAYLKTSTSGKEYYNLDQAFYDLGKTEGQNNPVLYIYPDVNHRLNYDVTIPKNATVNMILEYDINSTLGWEKNTNGTEHIGLDPSNKNLGFDASGGKLDTYNEETHKYNTKYLKELNHIAVADNVVINVKGSFNIYGHINGGSSNGAAGHTHGRHAAITLGENSHIYVSGSLVTRGFIYESFLNNNSGVTAKDSGNIMMPFVVRDFRGGQITVGLYNPEVSVDVMVIGKQIIRKAKNDRIQNAPFNQFELRNIHPKLKIENNASLSAMCNLAAMSNVHPTSNYLIKKQISEKDYGFIGFTTEHSYVEAKYNPNTEVCDLRVYGGAKINSFVLNVNVKFKDIMAEDTASAVSTALKTDGMSVAVDTSPVFFPVCWRYDVKFLVNTQKQTEAFYTLDKDVKFLPGSKLTVGEGVTLTSAQSIVFCDYEDTLNGDYVWNDAVLVVQDLVEEGYDPMSGVRYIDPNDTYDLAKTDAELFVYGTVTAAKIAGKITPMSENAKLNIATNTVVVPEAIGWCTDTSGMSSTISSLAGDKLAPFNAKMQIRKIQNLANGPTGSGEYNNLVPANYIVSKVGTTFIWEQDYVSDIDATITTNNFSLNGSTDNVKFTLKINNITLNGNPIPYTTSDLTIDWTTSRTDVLTIVKDGSNPLQATVKNFPNQDQTYVIMCTVSLTYDGKYIEETISSQTVIVSWKDDSGCFVEGTDILLADGSYKKVETLDSNDILMTFNHDTGRFESQPLLSNAHALEDAVNANITKLIFDNGNEIEIAYNHSFFNLSKNKYVTLDSYNYKNYIGDYFFMYGQKPVKLINGEVTNKTTRVFAPFTYSNINCIANGLLSVPGVYGNFLANTYKFEEGNMKIDQYKKASDIAQFGLFTYEDFANICPENMFELLHFENLAVGLGKNMYTMDDIIEFINRYRKYFE